ncbi:glycosyltransferase family 4 protein [Rhizobium sp. PAMB 3182]
MEFEVAQIIQEFSTVGGVERVAWDLALALGRLGQPNSVVCSTYANDTPSSVKIRPLVRWLSRVPKRGAMKYVGRMIVVPIFAIASKFAELAKDNSIIISHGDSLVGDIVVIHAVNAESLREKRRAGQVAWLFNPLHAWVAVRDRIMIGGLRFKRYVAVSERVKQELIAHYNVPEARIKVIPNGVDLSRFNPNMGNRETMRAEFGIPADARLLLFVGHEYNRKGLAFVISAMEKMTDSNLWLLVVGSENGDSYRDMAVRTAARIVFAGERRDMEMIYPIADAFVLPTAYETFSLVCMEAMASGVPIFATRVGGIENYLADGVNGYAIERNAEDIAAKLTMAFSAPEGLAPLKKGAIATSLRYNWDEVGKQYISLAEEIASEKWH